MEERSLRSLPHVDAHRAGGAADLLLGRLEVVGVEVGELDLGDLGDLGGVDLADGLVARGAEVIRPLRRIGPAGPMLTPGLIDVTAVPDRPDEEVARELAKADGAPDPATAPTDHSLADTRAHTSPQLRR